MYPRSAKRRKRKHSKIGLRMLQSGMAASVLLLYTSGQVGSTYGEFTTSRQQDSTIELCSVFPGQIEQLLSAFAGHIQKIIELKASLRSYSTTGDYSAPSGTPEISADELDQAAARINGQISAANSEMSLLDNQLSLNSGVWQQLLQEVSSAAAILNQLGGYMVNLEPNCLEIRDSQAFEQLQLSAGYSGILSESLTGALNGIVKYLSSIRQIGSTLPEGNPDRMLLRQESFGFPAEEPIISFVAKAYDADSQVSPVLQATYEQLYTDLTATKSSLSSAVGSLQNQLTQIADAKAKLQEKALAEEKKRLELEKKKQEEAAEALKQKEDSDKDGGDKTVEPPEDKQPVKDRDKEKPIPTEEATSPDQRDGKPAAETPGHEVIPTATPGDSVPEAGPAATPGNSAPAAAPPTPTPSPTPTSASAPDQAITPSVAPVPTPDPESSKGGE
ncbi:hypothetical protein [Paenibacillus sp. HW567]|uniref:hypothetical protein n=1 Tax=Paenibacillus sp. HW567 TaxID=1034769 RepID=UPI000377B35E|nr:hypothetical protein [Paenibacillus sp. HW567]